MDTQTELQLVLRVLLLLEAKLSEPVMYQLVQTQVGL